MRYDFKQAKFYTTVNDLLSLPEASKEIAIVGRSNAGKSSLLNALTNQNRLAFTSKTPGRTQHINYFTIIDDVYLVDLPGYGYAKVPAAIRNHWNGLLSTYLSKRSPLLGLVLIMDSRHPLRESDLQMIEFFRETGKPIHLVLSKSDKLTNQERIAVLTGIKQKMEEYGLTQYSLQIFSVPKRVGITELKDRLNIWLND